MRKALAEPTPLSPKEKGFKHIDVRILNLSKQQTDTSKSPRDKIDQNANQDTTRHLYSTGFVFKNSNSPIAANHRLNPDLILKPIVPVT